MNQEIKAPDPAQSGETLKHAAMLLAACTGLELDEAEGVAKTILGMAAAIPAPEGGALVQALKDCIADIELWMLTYHRQAESVACVERARAALAAPKAEGALPPLPEPHWPRGYYGAVPSGGYTADQMHAYARAALDAPQTKEQP